MSGIFITFEGLDGCGKSTQSRLLADWLRERRMEPVVTRQPGGTGIGDALRAMVLDGRNTNISPHAELAMMFADRAQMVHEVLNPALEAGLIVICDRFTDSTEAYQGGGRKLGSGMVLELHRLLCGGVQPDVTFLLRPSLERSLQRARRRVARGQGDAAREGRFEAEETAFFERVVAAYDMIAMREPERVIPLDGEESIQHIHGRIVEILSPKLRERDLLL